MVSNLSILFYSGDVVESGMSGGIFGLGAAYFTDEKGVYKGVACNDCFLYLFFSSFVYK